MVKTGQGSTNVFNITDPLRYRCQIHHYHRRLSRLYLSVYKGARNEAAFYLLFSDVAYVDAPTSWLGAEFDIAKRCDCIDLLLRVGLVGEAIHEFPAAYASITDYLQLYLLRSAANTIRIVASSAAILQDIPTELK